MASAKKTAQAARSTQGVQDDTPDPARTNPNEVQLSDDEVIARRTGPGTPEDGLFHVEFVVQATGELDTPDHREMHEANKVAVLQRALNQGLHPTGPAGYDGSEALTDKKSTVLRYSVPVVPASRHDNPADTYTPDKALRDLGGSTMLASRTNDPARSGGGDAGLK